MDTRRLLDLTLTALTAPLWTPLVGALAVLVLTTDGRPAFFVQRRLGRDQRPIRVHKLRTMRDDRVTDVGGWLRRRGLDELPQLYDVLAGRMALVGPRPITAADARRWRTMQDGELDFDQRFAWRPGLTGLAQIALARTPARGLALDLAYMPTATARSDLRILARTAWMNLVGKQRGHMRNPTRRLVSSRQEPRTTCPAEPDVPQPGASAPGTRVTRHHPRRAHTTRARRRRGEGEEKATTSTPPHRP